MNLYRIVQMKIGFNWKIFRGALNGPMIVVCGACYYHKHRGCFTVKHSCIVDVL